MLSLLACWVIGQAQLETPYGNPGDVEPFIGGFLQEVYGLRPMKDEVLGLYKYRYTKVLLPGGQDTGARTPREIRVGHMGHKVSNDIRDDKPVLRFETDALRTFYQAGGGIEIRAVFQRNRRTWVTPAGKFVRDEQQFRTTKGIYGLVADFKGDEVELVWTTPKSEKKLTLMPSEGVAAFEREFQPMIDGEKVLLKEKTFLRLDPEIGGFEKVTIRIPGRFEGRIINKQYIGHRIEYVTSKRTLTAYLSYDGQLLQVDLPRNHFLFAELVPEENEVGLQRLKKFGG